ncbi:GGDEF domain-containing protein [Varunaivibrio sulfuroxidans]|uniref:diguanylate cyclase n=1 Tax=Varunaivibrio sulfuroxidans TaxID=1773489 RepID=A0A4R3J987_9PROT|nr:diguanylate cyclase [Varunaivibrio sulfuroxidans]TCS62122.1 PAS domain S-box-containing protein/diguanylate cyclase (GGDEF)-like protein [Varunaivibrio sulfuroxidans]WES30554.1 diguanylate cyclase [Varunaivibrio sulfuroxidans]
MLKHRTTALGFAVIILLFAGLGFFSVGKMREMTGDVDNIYRHPFAVSNAAKNVKINLFAMHRDMHDILLAENKSQVDGIVERIDAHEQIVLQQFNVLFDRFLGDMAIVQRVHRAFVAWKPIRDQIIALARKGDRKAALALIRGRDAAHVDVLDKETQELVDFAAHKAESFHLRAMENERRTLFILSILVMSTIGASLVVAMLVLHDLNATDRANARRAHLIDQNILMCTYDKKGRVLDISNALCRFLGVSKDDILNTHVNFFVNTSDGGQTINEIWKTIKTGARWSGEIKRVLRDGSVKWAASIIVPILSDKADSYEPEGYSNILHDATNKKLSLTDQLTALYNRRRYEEIVDREVKIAQRNKTSLTLAILDVDYFKKYNDFYGHPNGDSVLRTIGGILKKNMKRPTDYAFRIGGEEFAILFSGLSCEESAAFLEALRASVEATQIAHEKSDVSPYVTISIGACLSTGDRTFNKELLYINADKALYRAKETRNTVVLT